MKRTSTYFGRAATMLALCCCVSGTSCGDHVMPRINKAEVACNQLRAQSGIICEEYYKSEQERKAFSLAAGVAAIVRRGGIQWLRCESHTNAWVCVNPDEKLWACVVRSTKEIAMYFPVLLHELRANTNAYVGITFARECVF